MTRVRTAADPKQVAGAGAKHASCNALTVEPVGANCKADVTVDNDAQAVHQATAAFTTSL